MMDKLMLIIFWLTTPIQKLMQKINLMQHWFKELIYGRLTIEVALQIESKAKSGHGLLSYESFHLTNWLIPGALDHAAIVYVDNLGHKWVVEAVGSGVQRVPIMTWLMEKKEVVLVERKAVTDAFMLSAGKWANDQIGRLSYDTLFRKLRKNSKKKVTYCARFLCDALHLKYNGVIEPQEILEMKDIRIICSTMELP